MATSTQQRPVQTVDPASTTEQTSPDMGAWLKAAAARKYRIEDGQVWIGGGNDDMVPVPPVPGFAGLAEPVQPLVFQAVAQFASNRVGQTSEGNVAEAVAKAMRGELIPAARDNDIAETLYRSVVIERVTAAVRKSTGDDKAVPTAKQIDDTAAKDSVRAALFPKVLEKAKADGLNRPTKERKRAKRSTGEAALDIDVNL